MNTFQTTMEQVGMFVDAAGVAVIVLGIIGATGRALLSAPPPGLDRYMAYRQNLGRAILLGLELLVAGDIIKTVAVSPTLQNMAVLGPSSSSVLFSASRSSWKSTGAGPGSKNRRQNDGAGRGKILAVS